MSVCAALRLCAADLRRWVQASAASAATVEAQAQEAVGPGGETASKGSLGPPFEPERPGPKWRSKHPRPRARPGTEPQPGRGAGPPRFVVDQGHTDCSKAHGRRKHEEALAFDGAHALTVCYDIYANSETFVLTCHALHTARSL